MRRFAFIIWLVAFISAAHAQLGVVYGQVPQTGAGLGTPNAGGPAATLNFAAGTASGQCANIAACVSVARASPETCTDASGNLTYVGNNVACITNAGVQVWEGRTNLHHHSSISDSVGSYTAGLGALSANATSSPDGNVTAASFTPSAGSNQHYFFLATVSTSVGQIYTYSVYAKPNGYTNFELDVDNTGNRFATFSLSGSGSVLNTSGVTATIIVSANGFYKTTVTYTAAGASPLPIIYTTGNGTARTYNADGASGYFFWAEQYELGSFSSPYIPTTTGSVTRAADAIQLTGNAATLVAATQASILAIGSGTPSANIASQPAILDKDNGNNNFIFLAASNQVSAFVNGTTLTATLGSGAATGTTKAGLDFDGTGAGLSANGGTRVATGSVFGGTTTPYLGSYGGSSGFYDGNFVSISLWSTRSPPNTN